MKSRKFRRCTEFHIDNPGATHSFRSVTKSREQSMLAGLQFSYVLFISQDHYGDKYSWTIFLVISLYFFWYAHARISGVRRTKHDVLQNKRSVMASNSFHRQCLQLEPFCKVCGAWFNKNSKKIFAVTTIQPSSTFFGANTADDNTEWSPANICYNTLN